MKRFVCVRRRARVFAAVLTVCCGVVGNAAGSSSTFDVKKDAFSISNAPGYCFAMAAFSRWYFLTNQGGPHLRQVFPAGVQKRIAKDLQEFYSKNLVGIQAQYCNRHHQDSSEPTRRLLVGLSAGEPRIVLLMNKGLRGAVLHAVLAYDWIPEKNTLRVYDPNYNNQERFIDLDKKEYTSLDIKYHAICFPEVLDDHEALVRKMETLLASHWTKGPAPTPRVVQMRAP
jgi:hypothetical protein